MASVSTTSQSTAIQVLTDGTIGATGNPVDNSHFAYHLGVCMFSETSNLRLYSVEIHFERQVFLPLTMRNAKLSQGSALAFDGLDDYLSVADADGLDFASDQDFTVEAWIKTSDQADTTYVDNDIVAKWEGPGGYPYMIRYLNQTDPDHGHIFAGRYDGTDFPYIISGRTVDDDRYHHVAFVKFGPILSLYLDGILDGITTDNTSDDTTNASPLTLGKRGSDSNYWFGTIDEVRIWNVARNQAEIQADMYRRLNGDETGLVGYWPLDEGEGDTAFDQTANGYHGSLGGGNAKPTWVWVNRPMNGVYLMALYNSTNGPNWWYKTN
jgi:hypothetical protein